MPIVGGLDIHRKQITFDYLDTGTGQVRRGQITPADRVHLRAWLARFAGRDDVAFAAEGCTGWRYVAEELAAAGSRCIWPSRLTPRLPAAASGTPRPKDRLPAPADAAGRGAAAGVLDPAQPHPGMPGTAGDLSRPAGRAHGLGAAHPRGLVPPGRPGPGRGCASQRAGRGRAAAAAAAHLSPAGQLQVATALEVIEALEARLHELRHELLDAARHLAGAKVLAARLYGVGPVTALAMTCWLGGEGRFSSSRQAVRFAGLDVTVYSSDRKGPPGRLSRQGPPVLRWAVYKAGKTHARSSAPDHRYYAQVKDRCNGKRAALSEARKILRQACHILAELGDDALAAA